MGATNGCLRARNVQALGHCRFQAQTFLVPVSRVCLLRARFESGGGGGVVCLSRDGLLSLWIVRVFFLGGGGGFM